MRVKATAALLVLLLLAGSIPTALGGRSSSYLYVSTYTVENRGDDPYLLTEDDATIPLFVNNGWQTVELWNATHAVVREYVDVDGNRMAVLDLPPEVPPNSSITFSVTYKITSTGRPKPEIDPSEAGPLSDIPRSLVEEFGVETETFTAGDEAIRALALRLAANQTTVLGVIGRLLAWLSESISYDNFEVPRYPNETLAWGLGDCDDQAILLITLCRALGIPAILQVGIVFLDNIESDRSSWGGHLRIQQRGVGWHGWALIYIPPWGWLPIDMTLKDASYPLSRITKAPEYESYVITCFNVSRQAYIGDSRRSRERLMASDIYITVSDYAVESRTGAWGPAVYVALGLSVGAVAVAVIVFLSRRRSRMLKDIKVRTASFY